jgi:ribosomal protein S18 acetylase RimI-like enzyme
MQHIQFKIYLNRVAIQGGSRIIKVTSRSLRRDDLSQVISMLQQISIYTRPTYDLEQIWKDFSFQTNMHTVVPSIGTEVVGYGCLVVEQKIRGGRSGHIEDIVSHSNYHLQGLGKHVVSQLVEIAKQEGRYKVVLNCRLQNEGFTKKSGFLNSKNTSMEILV